MDYIEETLGIKVQYQSWQYEKELPYYILDRYDFTQATIDDVKMIFLYPKTELDQMASVKKQIGRIQELENLPVVIVMKEINRTRRAYMISAKIPFVILDKQIYLPFMGIVLQDKFQMENHFTERLQPSTQVLFFYYIYQKQESLYMSQVAKELGFSAMTITRAVRQLEQTDIFTTTKKGVQKILASKYGGRELFEKMQTYLISPVRKKIYVDKKEGALEGYVAGLSALSELTMINQPDVTCYAVNGKNVDLSGTELLVDAANQIEVELWKYDPNILGTNGIIDVLSLVMTFKDNLDERIEAAIDELLNKVWED
ncbi:MAG: hypothetical protein ACK5LL_09865 [Suipraeoptans sp.]